ncbi:MAG: hypothetical protein H0U52_06045 [Chloroflexi bacterium]|nr:hypothetical protein [Chloroflexota bacterium]
MARDGSAWRLLSLAPAPIERVQAWFAGIDGLAIEVPPSRTQAAIGAAIGTADIVVTDRSNALRIDAAEVAAAEQLSFVMSPGVGLDNIDLEALTAADVVVANTAGLNAASVAEWCLGAAFAVARSLAWVDGRVRAGEWPQLELPERGSTEIGACVWASWASGRSAAVSPGCSRASAATWRTGHGAGAMQATRAERVGCHFSSSSGDPTSSNVRRAIAGEPIRSVVNGLGPVVVRREPPRS